ncbi:MAG: fibronectin type III domain-containing protein [Paludibacteraceae bacterium]|nr:fibronectin type III domain-containing protein [Paludibacteraceae bacterium]
MKRLMSIFAAVMCWMSISAAVDPAVTCWSANDLVKGYKGKVSFYFYNNKCQGDMRYSSLSACYAHIGLLTSASVDDQDIKYWGSGCNASSFGSTTELKGTSNGWYTWSFEFTDLYSFFGVTNPDEDITGIAMIFHDGNGASSKKGYNEYNRYVVIPFKKEPVCTYSVVMRSNWSIGWNGGCLNIWDNGYIHSCSLSNSENGVVAFTSYGGANKPKMIWTNSGYEEYASFDIIGAGGKILYTKDYDDVVTNGEVPFDLCSTEEGAYTLKNLKATDKGANVYAFSWDANLAYADYQLSIYDPDGTCIEIVETGKTQAELNLGIYTKNGSYRAVLRGRDADKNVFGGGTSTNFAVTIKEVGPVKVRLLVPSDSQFDATNGVSFAWYGSDNVRYPVKMTQEGTSHWWTATADVKVSKFNFEFIADLDVNKKAIAPHSGSRITNEDICCETGMFSYDYTDAGVTYYSYGLENVDCDKQDHNYTIASAGIKEKDGVVTVSITPKQDKADYYWVTLYKESHVYVQEFKTTDLDAIYPYTGGKPLIITSYEIEGYIEGEFYPVRVGEKYIGTCDVTVINPYALKNIGVGAKNSSNQYPITWDADERVAYYNFSGYDSHSEKIIKWGYYYPGKEIEKVGNKYRMWTDPVLNAGECQVYVAPKDENNNDLADGFDILFTADAPSNVGQSTIAVLIPEDICYFTDNGVWFGVFDGVNPGQIVKATQKAGTNIYEATVSGIDATSFELIVGNKGLLEWDSADKTETIQVGKQDIKFELYKNFGKFYLEEVIAFEDHNYMPVIDIQPNAAKGTLDITLQVEDKARGYSMFFYKEPSDPYSTYGCYIEPKEEETTTISYSYNPHATEETTIKRVTLQFYDNKGREYCKWDADISTDPLIVPRTPLYPTGLTAVKNTDGTYTLSWDANDGVKRYYINAYYGSTYLYGWGIDSEYNKPKDGKYSVVLDELKDNGTYKFSVDAYDWNDDYAGEAEQTFTVDQFPALGDVKVRIMVPTDRIPTLINDIWICWKLPDEAYDTDGRFVKTTKNGNWYEATLETGTATRIGFVAISQNSWSGSYKCSFGDEVMSKEACFEMTSDLEGYGTWPLRKVDCDAADHDYSITKLDVDNSKAGQVAFTITANQTAPYYVMFYKLHTASTWSRLIEWEGKEGLNQSYLFNNTTDREYDFQVKTYNEGGTNSYSLSEIVTKTIKANTNRPTALNIHIAEDEQTVTFSWYKNGEDVAGFNLIVIDYNDKEWLVEKNITGNSFTHTFIVPQYYYWTLQACNASGEVLAEIKELSFMTGGPNPCPTMLDVAVRGKKATLAWIAPQAIPMCHYVIVDSYTDEIMASGDVTGTDGQYRVEYTLNEDTTITYYWSVYSESADKEQLSTLEDGSYFVLNGSKADPAPASKQYTLTLTAAPGGSVNYAANGLYDDGEKVMIHANEYSDWHFDKWSDGNTQPHRLITMDKDITLQAFFKTTHSFSLYLYAGEGGSVNSDVNGSYKGGEKVTIIATPDEEYEFVMWSDGNTDPEREIVIVEYTTLTAIFKAIPYYTLSISAGEGGTVNTAVNKSYKSGTKVKIKATPKEDYKFVQWSDGNKEAEREVVMTKNITLKASFEEIIYYTLTVEVYPEAGGTVQFDGATLSGMKKKAEEGKTIVLSAKPADGYVFQYYEDGTDEIKTADYSVIMNKNKTVTAVFKKKAQGVEPVANSQQPTALKMLRDGQLYLIYNGTTYNVQGQEVK